MPASANTQSVPLYPSPDKRSKQRPAAQPRTPRQNIARDSMNPGHKANRQGREQPEVGKKSQAPPAKRTRQLEASRSARSENPARIPGKSTVQPYQTCQTKNLRRSAKRNNLELQRFLQQSSAERAIQEGTGRENVSVGDRSKRQ